MLFFDIFKIKLSCVLCVPEAFPKHMTVILVSSTDFVDDDS